MASDLTSLIADRLKSKDNEASVFHRMTNLKNELLAAQPDFSIIDLGRGDMDIPTHPLICDALKEALNNPQNFRYSDNGPAEFLDAVSAFMSRIYGVNLNPKTEINNLVGTKSALGMIPYTFLNPGDIIIDTSPAYPIFGTHAQFLGAERYSMPLSVEGQWKPKLDQIPQEIAKRAKILSINYPNNPTGGTLSDADARACVDFARDNNLLLFNDAAYSLFNPGKAFSILRIPGAVEVALESHSFSKSFAMTGWRLGWLAGNADCIHAIRKMKALVDSGPFAAIQYAGIAALKNDHLIFPQIQERYNRRLEGLREVFTRCGFHFGNQKPAGLFSLAKAPTKVSGAHNCTFESALAFSTWLLAECGICTIPFDERPGGAFIRFSSTFNAKTEADERLVFEMIAHRLNGCTFSW